MNCQHARELLDDYVDGALADPHRTVLERHLSTCEICRAALAEEHRFRRLLREAPVPAPTPGFGQRILHRVRDHHRRRVGFAAGFVTAAAAALALWTGSSLLPVTPADALPTVTLAIQQTKTVHLVFSAPRDYTDATLAIELPPGLEIVGYDGQRELVWQTNLLRGTNSLAIPLRATGIVSGSGLVARVMFDDREKRFEVPVHIEPALGARLSLQLA